jgi:hypothetical protein
VPIDPIGDVLAEIPQDVGSGADFRPTANLDERPERPLFLAPALLWTPPRSQRRQVGKLGIGRRI